MNVLTTLDATSFDAFTKTPDQLALVDFWAPRCGSCRQMMPQLIALSGEYAGSIKFGKLNVDDHPEQARSLQVHNLPCRVLFHDGRPIAASVGIKNSDELRVWLNTAHRMTFGSAESH